MYWFSKSELDSRIPIVAVLPPPVILKAHGIAYKPVPNHTFRSYLGPLMLEVILTIHFRLTINELELRYDSQLYFTDD